MAAGARRQSRRRRREGRDEEQDQLHCLSEIARQIAPLAASTITARRQCAAVAAPMEGANHGGNTALYCALKAGDAVVPCSVAAAKLCEHLADWLGDRAGLPDAIPDTV